MASEKLRTFAGYKGVFSQDDQERAVIQKIDSIKYNIDNDKYDSVALAGKLNTIVQKSEFRSTCDILELTSKKFIYEGFTLKFKPRSSYNSKSDPHVHPCELILDWSGKNK